MTLLAFRSLPICSHTHAFMLPPRGPMLALPSPKPMLPLSIRNRLTIVELC